ncbi:FAD-binding oxidoreductase [Agrobacterium sp. AGB01]|uniref:FAD-binding oxidoreductase n=1 Tax=Agrobacterium sp. AGB01 TaxID=2769302 RepID=UPI00177D01BC|nr:FAD-binding oxidoreductase [Agrobacterium sp. AGB01]MBD9387969.1 FAD-binding oxidoreductase [Agrobacterium sp. AGB01]
MSDIHAFISDLGDIPATTDPRTIRTKSRDHYSLSPLLQKTLAGLQAELVVSPRTKDEVLTVAKAAHKHRISLTPRGAGTANYGQSVPLRGGAMLDLSGLSGIVSIRDGAVRARAGTKIEDIEAAVQETGQELRFFPTTRRQATIGGFIAGGTGGVGSITWGVLRDRGNIIALEACSVEAEPQLVELRGKKTRLLQHGYGTNGIITEVEFALAPARKWVEILVGFNDYPTAIRHALAIGYETGLVKKLASAYEWPIGQWLTPFAPFVPQGQSVVMAMIDACSMELYREMVSEAGGTTLTEAPEAQGPYGRPMYEFAFGHTTLQVQKTVPTVTEVEGFFRSSDLEGQVLRVYERIRHTGPLRLEVRRWEGDLVCSGSTFITFEKEEEVDDVVRMMREEGIRVANPHASNVRGVGKKEIGPADIAFKKRMDPEGLLNPGRFEIDETKDAVIDKFLKTDGWLEAKTA